MTRSRAIVTNCLLALLGGCTGSIGNPAGPEGSDSSGLGAAGATGVGGAKGVSGGAATTGANASTPSSSATGANTVGGAAGTLTASCVTKAVGANAMRRLTHREYANAVRDLLGPTAVVDQAFAPDTQSELFDTMAAQSVSSLLADQYLDAATQLAQDIPDIKGLLGCDPAGNQGATCVSNFVKKFGRRAYRRDLTDTEQKTLGALYDTTRGASDASTGVQAVVAAVLASPNFLFRPEFGGDTGALDDALKATPFEIATRLSFLIWSSLPDDALLDAAAQGALATKDQIRAQAQRMLADARAKDGLLGFYEQWLGLDRLATTTKDNAAYPSFNDSLRDAMQQETERFLEAVIVTGDAKLSTLLTAPYSFVNSDLAKLYGVSGPSDAATFSKVALDPTQRSGVLTQASIMASYASTNESSPVKRGKWIRNRLLCQDLPNPPANVPPLPAPQAGVSTRERLAMHTASPACSGCHSLIDGLGFGLEHYDGIGAFRTMDQGVAVDSRGEITNTSDANGSYDGAPQLASILTNSDHVHDCVPIQWFRYALGRREGADDACSLAAMQEAFKSQDGDLNELLMAIAQSDAFANYRKPD